MALSSDQIREWSERGDAIHAWYSYKTVKDSLTSARLNSMSCAVYPQGSYANKTNIAADSDVDMVIALRSAFYPDKRELNPLELEEYAKHYEEASTTWHDFRKVVVEVLQSDFFLEEGSKCVKVRSNLIRLPADVLICLDHRYYESFPSFVGQVFTEGVQFYASGNRKIVNYPKRHTRACAQKDNWTGGKYRRVVRVAKNARNKLIAEDETKIRVGTAPSYFLESLLWNVPDHCYRGGTEDAYRRTVDWLHNDSGPLAQMDFPNGMGKLRLIHTPG
jgi:predicted nucleotidyltransferase